MAIEIVLTYILNSLVLYYNAQHYLVLIHPRGREIEGFRRLQAVY